MKKFTLILALILSLAGCSKKQVIYDPPKDLSYNEDTFKVSWTSVKDAISYEVSINDETYQTTDTYYDMSTFDTGIYAVKVKTIFKDNSSRYSLAINITIIKTVAVSVSLQGDTLTFESDTKDIIYQVTNYDYLGNVIGKDTLDKKTYKINSDIGFKRLDVKGLLNNLVIYDKTLRVNVDGYTYFSGDDYLLISQVIGNEVYLNGLLLASSNYIDDENGLSLTKAYLETLDYGSYELRVEGEDTYLTTLVLSETQKPKLTSNPSVIYEGSDVTFEFELYTGSFRGVYTNPTLEEGDYSFTNGVLTINKSYIDAVVLNEPDRKQIFFQYELTNNEVTVIGYLTILLSS